MKGKKTFLAVASATAIATCAAVLLASGNFGNSFNLKGAQAATFKYDKTAVTTRRIYFVNNDNYGTWYSGYNLSAQVWYGETYSGFVDAHEVYGNYYYYVDFTSEVSGFLGGDLHFQLRAKTGEESYDWTDWCYNIPSLDQKKADVVYVNNNKGMSLGTVNIGNNTGVIASVLDHYSTCVASYSNGYNAYPQLYVDFLQPNAAAIAAYGDGTMCEEGKYSINEKIAKMESLYNANGWTVSE